MSKGRVDAWVWLGKGLAMLGLAASFVAADLPFQAQGGPGLAYAQDDGDGDDGGGDDGHDGGGDDGDDGGLGGGIFGGGGGRDDDDDDDDDDDRPRFRQPARETPRRRPARPVVAAPLPDRAEREIVASGLTPAQAETLTGQGYAIVERVTLGVSGDEILRLGVPAGTTLESARDAVRALAPASQTDFNHFYRPGQAGDAAACSGRHCAAIELISWPAGGPAGTCGETPAAIGLIDTAINADHAVFEKGQVEVLRVGSDELPESDRQHGTAVAALLAGSAQSATPGLLPGAKLVAVDAFHRGSRADNRADVFALARALDALAGRGVGVINMSLSGPDNTLLADIVRRVTGKGLAIVAAAGNAGHRAEPVFPAAYPEVIAVTAVDRQKRVYRRAVRGDHIDISAPGVDIWTAASISGARPKTGTSFAAPFVTAAIALAHTPQAPLASLRERLGSTAQDLGEPGRDAIFGWGLLDAGRLCAAPP